MLYVAISRARQRSYVNFCDVDCKLQEGFIYKITNWPTNKLYIGSTKTSIEQRYQEHIKVSASFKPPTGREQARYVCHGKGQV